MAFANGHTYEMHPNPPARMPWEEYESRLLAEWNELLNSNDGEDERTIHNFLIQHPSLVPGAYSMSGPSGHGPFPSALLSEAALVGLGTKIPDFIWLGCNSANLTPVFIEIESPAKRWFTAGGDPHHDLTQALNQLAKWKAWLDQNENRALFYAAFDIPEDMKKHLSFEPQFVLIYGRRREFDEKPELKRLRKQWEPAGQVVMTFDRLSPARNCGGFVTATKRGDQRYRALAAPPTLAFGPWVARDFARIDGMSATIRDSAWMSKERRTFLIDRLDYWNTWARGERGVVSGGAWE